MHDTALLHPIPGADPCGADLRWDPEFMTISQALATLGAQAEDAAMNDEPVTVDATVLEVIESSHHALKERTRDLRLLAMRAEALWIGQGLEAFSLALEDLAAVAEAWPDPHAGVFPRADPEDDDLGERAAPIGKLLHRIPVLGAMVGWGSSAPGPEARHAVAERLHRVFGGWTARLEPAFGRDLPSSTQAWTTLRKLLGDAPPVSVSSAETAASSEALPTAAGSPRADAWDTLEQALELMLVQDRHSPAVPLLRMVVHWRSLGLLEIAESLRQCGLGLDPLLDALRTHSSRA